MSDLKMPSTPEAYVLRGIADFLREFSRTAPPEWRVDMQPGLVADWLDRIAAMREPTEVMVVQRMAEAAADRWIEHCARHRRRT